MTGKYMELEKKFNQNYKAAQDARSKNDFYTMVGKLRSAAQDLIDMADEAPYDQKGPLMERSKNLLAKAEQCQSAHPECFTKSAQLGSGSNGGKDYVVDKTSTKFSDIIGCEDVKKFVTKQYIKRFSDKYKLVFENNRGGALERGMLLFGLPGTGKTMIARAVATEVDANFMAVKASDLLGGVQGETERNIRKLYDDAAQASVDNNKPTIIFIDEIEGLIPSRSSNIQSFEASNVTEFLTQLDGFDKEKKANVITIAASNYPDRIDSAAIRPGRLGAWFRVDVPSSSLRKMLFEKHFSEGYTLDSDALAYAVKNTKGYSGADVVATCDRIKSRLSDKGIDAVDKGLDNSAVIAASSNVSINDVKHVLKNNNSSISQRSIEELSVFEKNYNFSCENGSIKEFMHNID